jgi:hypothetical protein
MSAKDEGLDQETLKLIEVMLDKNEERRFLDSPSLSSYARDLILLSNEFENAGEEELEQRCHAALGRVVEAQSPFMTSEGLQQYQHELLEALVGLPIEGAHVDAVEARYDKVRDRIEAARAKRVVDAQNQLTATPDRDSEPAEDAEPADVGAAVNAQMERLADEVKGQRVVTEAPTPDEDEATAEGEVTAEDPANPTQPNAQDTMRQIMQHLEDVMWLITGDGYMGTATHLSSADLMHVQETLVGMLNVVTGDRMRMYEEERGPNEPNFGPSVSERVAGHYDKAAKEKGDEIDQAHAEMAAKEPQGDAALSNALGRVADMLKGRGEA